MMITVTLYGTPTCRRYRKMRHLVLNESAQLNLPIQLDEISETAQLAQFNPLSLPRMHVNGRLVASKNPPPVDQIAEIFTQEK